MDSFPITGSHRKPEPLLAPAAAAGGPGLPRNQARPAVCVQAKAVASAPAGWQQERRKKSALRPGVRTRTREQRFVCPDESCEYRCTQSGHRQQHLRVHKGEKSFVCPRENCGYASVLSANLRVHLCFHSGDKPFICPRQGCGYASTTSCNLKKHLRVHKGEKPFVCPWENCGYVSVRPDDLKAHWRRHSGKKPFICLWENCGYVSRRSGDLTVHKRCHSGEKPFVCPRENCGYASGRLGDLKVHKRCHSGEKPFVCPRENCGYAFATSCHLKQHKRCHSGEKPFVCSWKNCGSAFGRLDHLKQHLRCHSGEKPFVCPWEGCGYASGRAGNVNVHLRRHSGEQPFGCPWEGCGRAFGQSASLARHVRRCAQAGSFVRLRKDSMSSGASCGHALARARSPSCCQTLETGQSLPVTTQHSPSPGCAAVAACLDAQAGLYPEVGVARQRTGVSSDSPGAIATVSSGICEGFDRGLAPSDGHKLRSPGPNLSPAPTPPVAQFEWEQSSSATGGVSDWLPWSTDHNLFADWPALCSSSASGLEVGSSLLSDDDKAFWRALLSPAHGEQ